MGRGERGGRRRQLSIFFFIFCSPGASHVHSRGPTPPGHGPGPGPPRRAGPQPGWRRRCAWRGGGVGCAAAWGGGVGTPPSALPLAPRSLPVRPPPPPPPPPRPAPEKSRRRVVLSCDPAFVFFIFPPTPTYLQAAISLLWHTYTCGGGGRRFSHTWPIACSQARAGEAGREEGGGETFKSPIPYPPPPCPPPPVSPIHTLPLSHGPWPTGPGSAGAGGTFKSSPAPLFTPLITPHPPTHQPDLSHLTRKARAHAFTGTARRRRPSP